MPIHTVIPVIRHNAQRGSKQALLVFTAIALAACTGGNKESSSSEAISSSSNQAVSSSSQAIQSSIQPESSSSVAESSSSITVPVSSAMAPSSSSIMTPSSSAMPSSSSSIGNSSAIESSSSVVESSSSTSSAPNSGIETLLTTDGTFSNGQGLFAVTAVEPTKASDFTFNNELKVALNGINDMGWHAQVTHGLSIEEDQEYTFCFKAKASQPRDILINIDPDGPPYDSLMSIDGQSINLGTSYETFSFTFLGERTDSSARMTMNFGALTSNDVADVYVDDIGIYEGSECGDPSKIANAPTGSGGKHIDDYITQNGEVPSITTQGSKVLFGGQPGSIAGVSLFWSNTGEGEKFYTTAVVEKLKNDWGAKLIRAAMAVDDSFSIAGYLDNPQYNLQRVTHVADAAIANNMYVIIDWHTHNAEEHEADAITFFEEMARKYKDNPNVIYEIYNEPDCIIGISGIGNCMYSDRTQWPIIKAYAERVIDAIRAIDPDNLIIVGTPFYSQDVDAASEDPILNEINIAYTLHFYAASHKQNIRSKAVTALRNGIPLFVTEWGTVNASGDGSIDVVETDAWMKFLYDNDISHANWSLTDKNEGASILRGTTGNSWNESNLTDSGRYIKQTIIDWNNSVRPN